MITRVARWFLPVLLAGLPSSATPQQRPLDQGTLIVLRGGQPVGWEEFTIRAGRSAALDGFTLSARVYRDRDTILINEVELGPDSQPTSVRIDELGGRQRRVLAQIGPRRVTVRALSAAGESVREYPVDQRLLVLDDSTLSAYAFAAYPTGPFWIVWPRTQRRAAGSLQDRGVESLDLGSGPVRAHHYELRAGDAVHLWYDDRGRLLKVEIPAADLQAVRRTLP